MSLRPKSSLLLLVRPLFLACGDDADPGFDGGPAFDTGPGFDGGYAMPPHCAGGPLTTPLPDCQLNPLPSTGDSAEDCVQRINQFRRECQCLPPLERWNEGESCARMHAEYDSDGREAHSGFSEGICQNGGRGQNECPRHPGVDAIVGSCLQQMWDEGPGEPFRDHGHYINMTNPRHSMVACGHFVTAEGRVWAVQNFR